LPETAALIGERNSTGQRAGLGNPQCTGKLFAEGLYQAVSIMYVLLKFFPHILMVRWLKIQQTKVLNRKTTFCFGFIH
jgi:hypothetical protein